MRVLLLFVEGTFDMAIVKRLFRDGNGWAEFKEPLSAFPSPLGGFLSQEATRRDAPGDRKIADLVQGEAPQLAFAARCTTKNVLILAYRLGGGDHTDKAAKFLKRLDDARLQQKRGFGTMSQTVQPPVQEWAFGFVVDADKSTAEQKLAKLTKAFGDTLKFTKLVNGQWIRENNEHEIGALVMRPPDQSQGTLEDLVEGAVSVEYRDTLDAARAFLDEHRPDKKHAEIQWSKDAMELYRGNDVIALRARKTKAALTIVGQYGRPSQGLGTILEHDVIFESGKLKSAMADLVAFIERGGLGSRPAEFAQPS